MKTSPFSSHVMNPISTVSHDHVRFFFDLLHCSFVESNVKAVSEKMTTEEATVSTTSIAERIKGICNNRLVFLIVAVISILIILAVIFHL